MFTPLGTGIPSGPLRTRYICTASRSPTREGYPGDSSYPPVNWYPAENALTIIHSQASTGGMGYSRPLTVFIPHHYVAVFNQHLAARPGWMPSAL